MVGTFLLVPRSMDSIPGQEAGIPHVHVYVCVLSHVQLFVTPWPVAHKAPLSMEFPGKNTGVGCHFLLQGIFLD